MRFMLLAIIPVVIVACLICICKLTGFSILPKELSTSNKQFKFPKLKRMPNGDWVTESESDDSEDQNSEEEFPSDLDDEPPYDPKLDEFTKPLKNVKRRKKKRYRKPRRRSSSLNISPNDPSYRILNGGLYD